MKNFKFVLKFLYLSQIEIRYLLDLFYLKPNLLLDFPPKNLKLET